jgi:hypothetical protein
LIKKINRKEGLIFSSHRFIFLKNGRKQREKRSKMLILSKLIKIKERGKCYHFPPRSIFFDNFGERLKEENK